MEVVLVALANARYHGSFKQYLEGSANTRQAYFKFIKEHGEVITLRQAYTWAKVFSEAA